MTTTNEEIGGRIKIALRNAKITQRQLSQELGMTEGNITSYIQGRTVPAAKDLATVADLCGVTIDWLVTGRGSICGEDHDTDAYKPDVSEEDRELLQLLEKWPEVKEKFNQLREMPDIVKKIYEGKVLEVMLPLEDKKK